jgi:RHS repeat-associated protein
VIPLSEASVPAPLDRIDLEVLVAGRRFTQSFPPTPNLSTTFTWDGQDGYGRHLQGAQPVTIRLGYHYPAAYLSVSGVLEASFGLLTHGLPISGAENAPQEGITIWQEHHTMLGPWDNRPLGLGAWSLSNHHIYNPTERVLYRGDGSEYRATGRWSDVINTVAGTGTTGYVGDGGPATNARLFAPSSVALGADGSFYIADGNNNVIRRVGPDGVITTVAGSGFSGYSGDGGPATQARLASPGGIDIGTDGSLYIADTSNNRIRRVGPDGIITTVAGGGNPPTGLGDGGLATQARLNLPFDVAIGSDGSLYVADLQNFRVRRVGPDGIISTVAGSGAFGNSGDGGPADQARFGGVVGVTIGPDGSLYITDRQFGRIRRVALGGIITTVAGGNPSGVLGDGGPATQAFLNQPYDVAFGEDGSFYIADSQNNRIRRVGPDGIVTTVVGTGVFGYSGDSGPSAGARLAFPRDVTLDPAGDLFIIDQNNHRVRKVNPSLPGIGSGNVLIPAEDGSEVYEFDSSGRHLRTAHSLTAATLYTFAYNSAGRLVTVTDGDNNVTTIERDSNGNPNAIVGPFGQRTILSLDANGYLASVTNPANEATLLGYTSDGLLTSLTDPRSKTWNMIYDNFGRLIRDENPAGGFWNLNREESTNSYSVTLTSAENRSTTYQVENLSTGSERRVNTLPNGLQIESIRGTDGNHLIFFPDGTETNRIEGPNPRWGMQAPLATSLTINSPAGLVSTYAMTRTITLTNPADFLSLGTMTDMLTINGRVYTSSYNATNKTFTITSPEERRSVAIIDVHGRVTQEQTSGLIPVHYDYDSFGRLAHITQGNGAETRTTTFSYNSDGYLSTIIDPQGRITGFSYDNAGRVTQQTLADDQVVIFAYDGNGNLISITPPGKPAHTFAYTSANLLETYMPPDIGLGTEQTQYIYNLDRQLEEIIRPDGQIIDPDYDNAGRLSSLTIPGGTSSYSYDPTTGNLSAISSQGGDLAYSYDGNFVAGMSWNGPVVGSVSFNYDNNYRLTTSQVNGINSIAFQYDADSLLRQAGALILNRDPQNGLLTGSTLGNVIDTWSYNGFGEPMSYTATFAGSNILVREYTRDNLGRITSFTEAIAGVSTTYGYTYSLTGRLTQVRANGNLIATYTYDNNGNRLSYTSPTGIISGTYDAQDRLLQYGTTTNTYTDNGELLTKTSGSQTTTYQYDALGNLVAVAFPDNTRIEYLVDGDNRRIGKKVNGVLVQGFLYKDQLEPIAELDGNNNVVSRFIYASRENVPDYMIKGGATYRIITDHLGSPKLVINVDTGVVAQRLDYDEFGRILTDTNPGFQPFGFAGGLYDLDTNLIRFGQRDYDAEAGRWIAKDTVRFAGVETNLYEYVSSDPVNWIDSTGISKTKGITKGDDPYLDRIREAVKDSKKLDEILKEADDNFRDGKWTKDRRNKIRTWVKLAKDGRLFGPGAAAPCITTDVCTCIYHPDQCPIFFPECYD